jgi:hypothetical protein
MLADLQGRYGLQELPLLYEGPIPSDSYEVSVVAVHGLGGDFYKTWVRNDPQKRTFWLSQLLPQDLPGARVFSFGYESAPTFSRSVTGISDTANALLHALKSITDEVRKYTIFSNSYADRSPEARSTNYFHLPQPRRNSSETGTIPWFPVRMILKLNNSFLGHDQGARV